MELLDGGDLYNYIEVNGPMSRHTALALFKKLVITVGELLSVGLYPGDLKTENLYYSKEKKCLIILDLGGMKHINKRHGIDKKVATTCLSPPESHLEEEEVGSVEQEGGVTLICHWAPNLSKPGQYKFVLYPYLVGQKPGATFICHCHSSWSCC